MSTAITLRIISCIVIRRGINRLGAIIVTEALFKISFRQPEAMSTYLFTISSTASVPLFHSESLGREAEIARL
jgi:hypothetical protein